MEKYSSSWREFINVCEQKSAATSSDLNLLKNHRYGNYCVFYLIIKPLKLNFMTALIYAQIPS